MAECATDRNDALLRVKGWIGRLAGRYARGYGLDRDEVFARSCVAFLRYYRGFDSTRGSLTTWAALVVRSAAGRLNDELNTERRAVATNTVPLADLVAPDGMDPADLMADCGVNPSVQASANEDADLLRRAVAELPDRLRALICQRYGLDDSPPLTQLEVATARGVSRARVAQLETRALSVLWKAVRRLRSPHP